MGDSGERAPLLHYRLLSVAEAAPPRAEPSRKLNTFFGVVVPTLLSMFSVVLYLRIGFVVGQAGLLESLLMFAVAYVIIGLTVLSVCAISTNGAVQGGGVYFMISRALGPEFGGSIGVMFFLANVCSSAVFLLGLTEAIMDSFRKRPDFPHGLPDAYIWVVLYASCLLLICLVVVLVGADIYSKAAFIIFLCVILVLLTVFISFFAVRNRHIVVKHGNVTLNLNYSGPSLGTLHDNLKEHYTQDYTTGVTMNFASVFAIMFNGCTGIMAGSNMSGDLKDPSYAIPRGTIAAVVFTFCVYVLLCFMVSCSCPRDLLLYNYVFMRDINVWGPFVTIGIYAASLSAAMSCLIGASRVLHAVALDDIFGVLLKVVKRTSRSGNPWVAVLVSWFLVQLVLFAGQLNTIAGIVTVFFLIAYATVDLACLAMEWASAPNFRPTFQFFSWHTCLLGMVGCLIMMFIISPIYASASIAVMLLLLVFIHYRSPSSSWGYISQALIFHQVRKYLLLLDIRKDHVKFWRPQILLMVANPRSSCHLIHFVNDIKKGGLYILGHVEVGDLDSIPYDPLESQVNYWLSLVDKLNVKAFVDITLSPTVRQGVQNLLRIAGLGGMKPNTLFLGFYDDCVPDDYFLSEPAFAAPHGPSRERDDPDHFGVDTSSLLAHFPPVHALESPKALSVREYVAVVSDAIKMKKNVCLSRYFHELDMALVRGKRRGAPSVSIDVWPLNLLRPDSAYYVDVCSLFLLQMACILNMVSSWRHAKLRIFLCVESSPSGGMCESSDEARWRNKEEKLRELLSQLRIKASIHTVHWDQVVALHWSRHPGGGGSHDHLDDDGDVAMSDIGGFRGADGFPAREREGADRVRKRPLKRDERLEEEQDDGSGGSSEEDHPRSSSNATLNWMAMSDEYLRAVNRLVLGQELVEQTGAAEGRQCAVRFLYLPRPPADPAGYERYLRQLETITDGLGPTLLIHGVSQVTSLDM
ncbi:solute carrier family 12 member 9 [Lampetra planeri]